MSHEEEFTLGRTPDPSKLRPDVLLKKEELFPTYQGLIIIRGKFTSGDSLLEEEISNPNIREVVDTGPPGSGKTTKDGEKHKYCLLRGIPATVTLYDPFIQKRKRQILGLSETNYTNQPVKWTPEDLHSISDGAFEYIVETLAEPGQKKFREVPGVGNPDTFDFGITTVRKLVRVIYGDELNLVPNINRRTLKAIKDIRKVKGFMVERSVPDPRMQRRTGDLRTIFKPVRSQDSGGEVSYYLPHLSSDVRALSLDYLLTHVQPLWRKEYSRRDAPELRRIFTYEMAQEEVSEEYYQLPVLPHIKSMNEETLLAQIEDILRDTFNINVSWITPPESPEEGGRIIIKALDEAAPKRVIDLISAAMKEQVVGTDFPDIPPLPPLPKGYPYAEMTSEIEAELQWNIRYAEQEMDLLYSLGLPKDRGIIVLNPYSNKTTNWFLNGRAEEQKAS